jgi:hypothetical protein
MGDLVNKYSGSDFDDFLREEGILEEVTARAHKRLLALQLSDAIEESRVTKKQLAEKLQTSRSPCHWLLVARQQQQRILDQLRDAVQKACCRCAVDDTVIEHEAEDHRRANGDGVLLIHHNGLAHDLAHAQDATLASETILRTPFNGVLLGTCGKTDSLAARTRSAGCDR